MYITSAVSLNCQTTCIPLCVNISIIPSSKCADICQNHCLTRSDNIFSKIRFSCFLKCNYYEIEKKQCEDLCLNDETDNNKQSEKAIALADSIDVCIGYGTESCYAYCRLKEFKSIRVCKCACCGADFCNP